MRTPPARLFTHSASAEACPQITRPIRKGIANLLQTQLPDGTWLVHTRSYPVQPYFESGFPHGPDQWISAAATSWATLSLDAGAGQSEWNSISRRQQAEALTIAYCLRAS